MAWPPPALPITQTNASPQFDQHPRDHAAANQAINDIVAKVIAIETEVIGAATLRSWTPQITAGGNFWGGIIGSSVWVDLGSVRLGYLKATTANQAPVVGGLLVGGGFWTPGSNIIGFAKYFKTGTTNRILFAQPYDANAVGFLAEGSTALFATNSSPVPEELHVFLVAWEG